jgi:hypothetical protein
MHRAALAAVSMQLAACIPAPLELGPGSTEGIDGTAPDVDASQHAPDSAMHGNDASPPVDSSSAPVESGADASDAGHLMQGYVQCATTSVACDVAAQQECCLFLTGTLADGDAGSAIQNSSASCDEAGTCGSGFTSIGSNFTTTFAQTCSTAADCAAGSGCCAAVDPMDVSVLSIACQAACAAPGRLICRSDTDCVGGKHCLPETDPILMQLYAKYCQ